MQRRSEIKAVLISDIHFTVPTLELAYSALSAALKHAETLKVPLIIAGDTLDSKAIMRGECVNALIDILKDISTQVYILVGNHDLINEKGKEHTLNFLKPYATIVDKIQHIKGLCIWMIPYQSDTTELIKFFNDRAQGDLVILHQGVQSADMGHYQFDNTSLPKETFEHHRVISGHYHKAQDIKCGRPRKGALGLFSYIGNPYTLSFGEADHPPKGYSLLDDNGILTHVPLNLRKHVVVNISMDDDLKLIEGINKDDIIWVKAKGAYLDLCKLDKKELGAKLFGHCNFRLDKILIDAPKLEYDADKLTDAEILDTLIDNTNESGEEKKALKFLWREVIE